jgi:DNA-binding transcriptional LysR family regulator
MLAQAAAAGSGAALLPRFLIEPELESGVLVTPFETALVDEGRYYLVLRPDWREHAGLVKFHDWLVEAVRKGCAPPRTWCSPGLRGCPPRRAALRGRRCAP